MRLSAHLIADAPTVINPEGKYTLQLRDLQIPYLENLGITADKFAVIDLTNNDILDLANIPTLRNLEVLLVANNAIGNIDKLDLPSLHSLSLANNKVVKFSQLFNLHHLPIHDLVLWRNPITKHEEYRLFVVWMFPSLKVLDFNKVKQKERLEAAKRFGSIDSPTAEAAALLSESATFTPASKPTPALSDAERKKLLFALESADSIDEIERIESLLKMH